MSKLFRRINKFKRQLEDNYTTFHHIVDTIMDIIEYRPNWYYAIKRFIENLPIFLRMAWKWRSWDSSYTVDALADLLEAHAKTLKVSDFVTSEKQYRRCMNASGMLRRLYYKDIDKTIAYLMDKNPWDFEDIDNNMRKMLIKFKTDKRIYNGMYKVAEKRSRKWEEEAKDRCWSYIRKYIEYWWY